MTNTVHIEHPNPCPTCCPDGCRDPYVLFGQWMRANGYADVCDAVPERVDLARLDAAVIAYARQPVPLHERVQRRDEARCELPANRLKG